MATIEERAYEHYPINLQKSNDMEVSLKNDAGWDGYVVGATEQRKIDTDKACSLVAELFSRPAMKNFDKALDDFKKAMEE